MGPVTSRERSNAIFEDDIKQEATRDDKYKTAILEDKELVYNLELCGIKLNDYKNTQAPLFMYSLYLFMTEMNHKHEVVPEHDLEISNKMVNIEYIRDFADKLLQKLPF